MLMLLLLPPPLDFDSSEYLCGGVVSRRRTELVRGVGAWMWVLTSANADAVARWATRQRWGSGILVMVYDLLVTDDAHRE